MRWPPSTTLLAVVPPRTARRDASGTPSAQRRAIGLHHGGQNLLAGVHAQADKSGLNVSQHALHGQRDLELGFGNGPRAGLRERLHFGGSFLCLVGTRMIPCGRKEMILADQDGWDRYEAAKWLTMRRWLDANPDDELAKEIRAQLTSEPERYAAYTREYLGWGVFALMAR